MSHINFSSGTAQPVPTAWRSWMRNAGLLGGALLAAGVVHAQSATTAPSDDGSLTWKGITLYGIIDLGLQYQTHGAPISDYYPAGSADIVQKNSNHSITGATPSNLSQSRIGLQGVEPLYDQFSAVFKVETYFNPQSGQLSDGLRSLAANNGRTAATQTTNLDSSVAGQPFEQAYLGITSKDWGTLTFGRQNTLLADAISKYDPNYASQAFSVIGLSGTTAGAGDTQSRRFDDSLKYAASYFGMAHVGAQYKFNQSYGGANQAVELNLGGEYAGLSIDGYYVHVRDAISAGALSATQVTGLAALGYSVQNSLAGTVSDNTSFSLMGLYNWGGFLKFFAGFEHIKYANPTDPLTAGYDDLGYKLAYVNNTAYTSNKLFDVYWAGVRYSPIPQLDLVGAYYGYHQLQYATGTALAGCQTSQVSAGSCNGTLDGLSFDVDYRVTKRFDVYAGVMYTIVYNGLASGYAFSRDDLDPTIGGRFKF